MNKVVIGLLGLAACSAAAINGPVSGFVVDARMHALRPLNGFPGSAVLGAPLPIPFPVGSAAVAAGQDYAIVTDARSGQPFLARGLASGAPDVAPLAGAIDASRVGLSPASGVGVLYSRRDGRVQFLSGLPAQPRIAGPTDVSSLGGVTALALDPGGTNALIVAGNGGIYWMASGAAPRFVVSMPGASSAAVLQNGADAAVGNGDTGDVFLIRGVAGAASVSTLTGARDGISAALAVRAIGTHAIAVVDGSGRVAAVDTDTASVDWLGLSGRASSLDTIGDNLLALNQPGVDPLLLLDLSVGRTVFFVPPDLTSVSHLRKGADLW
jgi:hypothetical protein